MDWNKVLEALTKGMDFAHSTITGAGRPATGKDIAIASQPPMENRGALNILSNVRRTGAVNRAAEYAKEGEDVNRALKGAQTKYYGTLGEYKMGLLDVRREKNEISRFLADLKQVTDLAGIEAKKAELENKVRELEIKQQEADTGAKRAQNEVDKAMYERDRDQANYFLSIYKAILSYAIQDRATKVQEGYLGIEKEKLPVEIESLKAGTALKGAQAGKAEAEATQLGSPVQGAQDWLGVLKQFREIPEVSTPEGLRRAFNLSGLPGMLGSAAPEAPLKEKVRGAAGLQAGQPAAKVLTPERAKEYFDNAPGATDEEKRQNARRQARMDGWIIPSE